MTDADMAERIYHPLVSEDTAGGDEVFDNSRIDWPTRSGLGPRWLVCEGNRKRCDDDATSHVFPRSGCASTVPSFERRTAAPTVWALAVCMSNDIAQFLGEGSVTPPHAAESSLDAALPRPAWHRLLARGS